MNFNYNLEKALSIFKISRFELYLKPNLFYQTKHPSALNPNRSVLFYGFMVCSFTRL